MRIAVLRFDQSPEMEPMHFVSRDLAAKMQGYYHNGKRSVIRVSDRVLKIAVNLEFGQIKAICRKFTDSAPKYQIGKPYIPTHMPPREIPSVYFKPPVKPILPNPLSPCLA